MLMKSSKAVNPVQLIYVAEMIGVPPNLQKSCLFVFQGVLEICWRGIDSRWFSDSCDMLSCIPCPAMLLTSEVGNLIDFVAGPHGYQEF